MALLKKINDYTAYNSILNVFCQLWCHQIVFEVSPFINCWFNEASLILGIFFIVNIGYSLSKEHLGNLF